jgi:hypothetical protein
LSTVTPTVAVESGEAEALEELELDLPHPVRASAAVSRRAATATD